MGQLHAANALVHARPDEPGASEDFEGRLDLGDQSHRAVLEDGLVRSRSDDCALRTGPWRCVLTVQGQRQMWGACKRQMPVVNWFDVEPLVQHEVEICSRQQP